ncbi:MAG TPA: hypothetical protein VF039_14030 [Longimicrobiales bacterium]
MSEQRWAVAGALALALIGAQPAQAQEPHVPGSHSRIERLRLRADSLERALTAAEALIEERRSSATADRAVLLDTQRVGPLTVVSDRRESVQARETVRRALAELGGAPAGVERLLDSTYLVLAFGGNADAFDLAEGAGARVVRLTVPQWMPRSTQVRRVARSIAVALGAALPDDLRTWSGSAGVALAGDDVYREAYRTLSLSTSPAARACLAGVIERCMDALSLTEPGASWQAWYDEAGLVRWAVSEAGRVPRRERVSTREAAARACDEGRTFAACRSLIEQRGGPPPPLQPVARASLLAFALEEGGAAAWGVLAADKAGTIADRLGAAAGMDAPALLEAWRARVVTERPTAFADLGRSSASILLWLIVLAALASRSTRWRLG